MSLTSHNILFSLLVFLALEEIVYQKKKMQWKKLSMTLTVDANKIRSRIETL